MELFFVLRLDLFFVGPRRPRGGAPFGGSKGPGFPLPLAPFPASVG